ncbi:MAG: hypothetical protein DWP94_12555 [Flavobacterium sp.]|nr:MAG: hypothetical protein DWP94_12555 [Flavobacterium sp.]
MDNIFENIWVVTIVGGVIVGVIILIIGRRWQANKNRLKEHELEIEGKMEVGGDLTVGDKFENHKPESGSHKAEIKKGAELRTEGDTTIGNKSDN